MIDSDGSAVRLLRETLAAREGDVPGVDDPAPVVVARTVRLRTTRKVRVRFAVTHGALHVGEGLPGLLVPHISSAGDGSLPTPPHRGEISGRHPLPRPGL
jgi:hypothetical protein